MIVTATGSVGGAGVSAATPWTIANSGNLYGTNTAVSLLEGGDLRNTAGAVIRGANNGVIAYGAPCTVTNAGVITEPGDNWRDFYAVKLTEGGSVDNSGSIWGRGLGVYIFGAPGTVTNSGTIFGKYFGIGFGDGGSIDNTGTISGLRPIDTYGVATVTNSGALYGTYGFGILLSGGGWATNTKTGFIHNYNGVVAGGGFASVTNAGTIAGSHFGVQLNTPGDLLTNDRTGVIEGNYAVYMNGSSETFENAGTISKTGGKVAVVLNGSADRLIVDAGAVFAGEVVARNPSGPVTSTLELSATYGSGTLTGFGSQFQGFSSLVVDSGASWTLRGTNMLAAGQSLTDSGQLTLAGSFSEAAEATVSVSAGAAVTIGVLGSAFDGTIEGAGTVSVLDGSETFDGATIATAGMTIRGADVTLLGTITNSAIVLVNGGGLTVGSGGAVLSGSGSWALSNNAANLVTGLAPTDTLTLASALTGAGQIGDGQLSLDIQAAGSIDASDTQAMVVDTGATGITNAGLIEATGAGGMTIESALANNGMLLVSSTTLTEQDAVSGTGSAEIKSGGTLTFMSAFSENVGFIGTGGELVLFQSQGYSATVSGFSRSGSTSLDLRDIGFVSASEATWSGGVLTVTDGTHTAHINLAGRFSGSTFIASSDGHGGVLITDPTLLREQVAAGFGASSERGSAAEPVTAAAQPLHLLLAAPAG